jgi:hypothetical protein
VPGGNVARMKRLLGQFICTLLIVAFVLHFIWWIVGAGVVIAAAWFAVRMRLAWLAAEDAERRRRAEIAARADQQQEWRLARRRSSRKVAGARRRPPCVAGVD